MIRFNYYVQIAFGIILMLILVSSVFVKEMLFYVLYFQFVVGTYQFPMSLYFIIRKDTRTYYQAHLIASTIMIGLLVMMFSSGIAETYQWLGRLIFLLPWGLAVYFGYQSFKLYKG